MAKHAGSTGDAELDRQVDELDKLEERNEADGYSDSALALWGADDVEDLADFMDVEVDFANAPTADEASRRANMALPRKTNELIGHTLGLAAWRPQEAMLVSTGEITQGFYVVGKDLTTGDKISFFVGATRLVKQLRRWSAPVRVQLKQSGRTLVFE